MTFELTVVGGGNMGAALIGGLLDAGAVARVGHRRRGGRRSSATELSVLFPGIAVTSHVPACRAALLAVKPDDVPAAARDAAAAGARGSCRSPPGCGSPRSRRWSVLASQW